MKKFAEVISTADPIVVTNIPQNFDTLIVSVFCEGTGLTSRLPQASFGSGTHITTYFDADWNWGSTLLNQTRTPLYYTDRNTPATSWLEITNYSSDSSTKKQGQTISFTGSTPTADDSDCEQAVHEFTYTGDAIDTITFASIVTNGSDGRQKIITIYGV